MKRVALTFAAVWIAMGASAAATAQAGRGVVLDQTGLPLAGVTVQLLNASIPVLSVTTGPDGTFVIDATLPGDMLVASLDGFETARVARSQADRIVLEIARATETTTVVAPAAAAAASPSAALLGSTLTAANVARLPSSKMRAKESLPLLPSVMRGPDGLLQLGGARAHDAPLFLDGFNVTDPATGISSINLPFEAVRGVDVLRDPMAVTYGGLIAGVVKMESNPGGDRFRIGAQGVVPRPRFASPGFGRLEGIFPRVYVNGPAGARLHYFAAVEYDYERIPVPEVTRGRGPDIVEESATFFGRIDARLNDRHAVTVEGLAFPSRTRGAGLSPRREETAASDLNNQDLFAGVTHRFVRDQATVFTIQIGALAHEASLSPRGSGVSFVSPAGWHGNWFATASRTALRYTAAATWEHLKTIRGRTHDITLSGEVASRRLRGEVEERPVVVENGAGQVVRVLESGPQARFGAHDRPLGVALRDLWSVGARLQLDAGLRLDHSRHGGGRPSARAGARYALDAGSTTVLKAGYGSFVGSLPLGVPAFAAYPERIDRRVDSDTGAVASEIVLRPAIGPMRLPHASAATIGLERQLAPGIDAQVVLTDRQSHRLATLSVPAESGSLVVASTGSGHYREVQVAVRRAWEHEQQLFVSYVRSSARGELNDFAALFHALDAPLLQPGGMARLTSDARHRVIAWGTFNLPRRVVLSPVTEWRSGFLYSPLDERYTYAAAPNSRSFPAFMATDLVIYKTFTVRRRSADVGMQLFNATNHRNPRDVYAVTNASRYGQFTNSVGPIVRGYMLVKW